MKQPNDPKQTLLLDYCAALSERIKLLRDYGTTPGNIWLAKNELTKIQQIIGEIESLLSEIDSKND